ncbi:SH3 domain-binding glutamic acid-rich protein-like [Tropilaelaps mercedesae]|uniref:SH3 domain-binding glutamic acid-rich protein-like n=1 Tax=Tropilaelaps mercedesae TaxID=418985 RepID=A0A1V9X7Y8_9ACAR|nr:SH3 domain-binding glutamic acid-rich protein-like [Tropilaelaps mercedesae]
MGQEDDDTKPTVIKLYVSGISASKEVKKRQQRAAMILTSIRVKFEEVDITEPGREEERELVKKHCKNDQGQTLPPPHFFNGEDYCGSFEDFDVATESDRLPWFLKLDPAEFEFLYEKSRSASVEKGEGDTNGEDQHNGQGQGVDAKKVIKKLVDQDGAKVLEMVMEKEETIGVTEEVIMQNEDGTIEIQKNVLEGRDKEEQDNDEDEGEVVETEEIVTELPDGSYEVTRTTRRKSVRQGAPPPELLEGADEIVEEADDK